MSTAQAILAIPVIILFWVILFALSVRGGLVMPANAGANDALTAMQKIREHSGLRVDVSNISYDYILFSPDGNVLESTLSENEITEITIRYPTHGEDYSNAKYVHLTDGNYYLFVWNDYSQIKGLEGIPADWILIALILLPVNPLRLCTLPHLKPSN